MAFSIDQTQFWTEDMIVTCLNLAVMAQLSVLTCQIRWVLAASTPENITCRIIYNIMVVGGEVGSKILNRLWHPRHEVA
jgi:hypothetical protein